MRIVIDIPDKKYNEIMSRRNKGYTLEEYAILKGTVLPKGHGDLIDRNTVQMSAEKFHSLGDLYTAQWLVDIAPIVIKADKENKE